MAVTPQAQTSLDERVVEDAELERLLEERETAKTAAAAARKSYAGLDEQAKGRIRALELAGPARVGRFLIAERDVDGHAVAFETSPSKRVSIRVAPGEVF